MFNGRDGAAEEQGALDSLFKAAISFLTGVCRVCSREEVVRVKRLCRRGSECVSIKRACRVLFCVSQAVSVHLASRIAFPMQRLCQ